MGQRYYSNGMASYDRDHAVRNGLPLHDRDRDPNVVVQPQSNPSSWQTWCRALTGEQIWCAPGKAFLALENLWGRFGPVIDLLPYTVKDALLGFAVYETLSMTFRVAALAPGLSALLAALATVSGIRHVRSLRSQPTPPNTTNPFPELLAK